MVSENTEKLLNQLNDDLNEIASKAQKEESSNDDLYKVSELRPLPFSKTVTIFDVYETDEENFEPYISPLATVGTIPSSSPSETQTSAEGPSSITGAEEEQTEENSGILGMGTGII